MFLNEWKLLIATGLLLGTAALAEGQEDQRAYCTYVMEQAQAQRDFLRSPTASAGFTQPETGLPMQVVGGASLGLSEFRKAGLTMEAARKNCEVYKASTAAQQEVQYALAGIEKEALLNRLALIEQASQSLGTLMEQTSKMLEVQNATRLMLFTLQTTKIKLEADRADTRTKLSAIYVPPLSDRPLKELVVQTQSSESDEQKALAKLSRQNNWDVLLTVGVHQQVNPVDYGPQPYGQVSINYNLARRAIDRHLDRAVEAHDEWKKVQEGDVVRQMEVLRQQLLDGVTMQQAKLNSFREQGEQVEKDLKAVAAPDTAAAFDFHNQLAATLLLLQIETDDASFRIARLREYLGKNY
jgi:hypothetical protein